MVKKIICLILLLSMCGHSVFAAKVGYTNSKCYVYKQPSTAAAHKSIAKNTKLYYVNNAGKFYCVKVAGYSTKVYILKKYVSKTKTSTKTKQIEKIDWNKGKSLVKVKQVVTLYSVENHSALKVKRCGGTNHMDLEPYTEEDTTKLWHIAQGYFSWKCHPMILEVGNRHIACSINTMPHGKATIRNNDFEGHFCLHLVNSKTHGTNTVNPEHQKQIEIAYKRGYK